MLDLPVSSAAYDAAMLQPFGFEGRRYDGSEGGDCAGFRVYPKPLTIRHHGWLVWFVTDFSGQRGEGASPRGAIAARKLADMILIESDPTKNMGDIRKIATVIKSGTVYTPAAIEGARHRAATTSDPGPPSIIEAIPRQLPMRRARNR